MKPDYSSCLHSCEGTIVPLILKEDVKIDMEDVYSDILKQYRAYKGDNIIPFPETLKGLYLTRTNNNYVSLS